ncbi:MAG TPA: hypothetical protein VGM08_01530, partial [Candidatus Saccharimonadales bacterium]
MAQPVKQFGPYDDNDVTSLSARERANQRWGISSPANPSDTVDNPTSPDLHAINGGGETTDPKRGHLSAIDNAEGLNNKKPAKDTSAENLRDAEEAPFRYKSDKKRPVKGISSGLKRKAGILGSILGIFGITGGLLGITGISRTGEFIQYSHILQVPMAKGNSDSASRVSKLFRVARVIKTGDINQTRLSYLDAKIFKPLANQMADNGVTIETGRTGQPTKTFFDINKLKAKYPDLDGMNSEETKNFLAG